VNLLLDTSVLLWWLADDPRLPASARDAVPAADAVVISAATVWEIGIKQALGKLRGPNDVEAEIVSNGFQALSITPSHATAAARLPPHHADPFDRMIIAQAIAEGLTVVTSDRRFADYGVPRLA